MHAIRVLIWITAALGVLVAVGAPLIFPELLRDASGFSFPVSVGYVSMALSFLGLLFSIYAAVEVRRLANEAFFKVRSPKLRKKVSEIAKLMSDFASEPSADLPSQEFLSAIPVVIRSAQRIKNRDVASVASEVQLKLAELTRQMKICRVKYASAAQIDGYWELYLKISELSDELREQLHEKRAAL